MTRRLRGPCSLGGVALRFVIIGGGPAGNTAATHAARLGAEVTLIEKDIVGGAAHLWDCIPSKAMIATGGAKGLIGRAQEMGLTGVDAALDLDALKSRIAGLMLNIACYPAWADDPNALAAVQEHHCN